MEQPTVSPCFPCLLYLSADRICRPVTHYRSAAGQLGTNEQPVAVRLGGRAVDHLKAANRKMERDAERNVAIAVPCRESKVWSMELGSRLLMAALLECRDSGLISLRLADDGKDWPGLVRVTSLGRANLPGLRGRLLDTLGRRRGEQGVHKVVGRMLGNNGMVGGRYGGWHVIKWVHAELADLGYLSPPVRLWPIPFGFLPRLLRVRVDDCEKLRALEEGCASAVAHWERVWSEDSAFCYALLADCTDAIAAPQGGG
jgi:hypothetical protein